MSTFVRGRQAAYQDQQAVGLVSLGELAVRLSEPEETRLTAERELDKLRYAARDRSVEQDVEALLAPCGRTTPKRLGTVSSEKRHYIYRPRPYDPASALRLCGAEGRGLRRARLEPSEIGTLFRFYTKGMSVARPICFLSDYGLGDDFVGLCKGAMLRIAPGAPIVDLTHHVPSFGVEAGAEILEHATRYMPEDAVYLAVVDPGVGTRRRAVALSTGGGALLVGPDNGLLVPAAGSLGGIVGAVALTNPDYHIHPVSSTFHGRDIFAPAAAHLAAGLDLRNLGATVEPASLARIEPIGARKVDANTIVALIVAVDRYGNTRLSATEEGSDLHFGALLKVEAGEAGEMSIRYVEAFGYSEIGDLVLVPDSHRRLSLSINQGNASRALGLKVGDEVRLTILEDGPSQDETP